MLPQAFVFMVVAFLMGEIVGSVLTSIKHGGARVERRRVGLGGMLMFFLGCLSLLRLWLLLI